MNTRRAVLAGLAASSLAAPALAQGPRKGPDVIVLGAGLAGLHAARLLEAEGMTVQVYEASNRAGGRMLTLDDLPGTPESGGAQVGGGYARIRATCDELGVGLRDLFGDEAMPDGLLCLKSGNIRTRDWGAWTGNPFPETYKRTPPTAALFRVASAQPNPFVALDDWIRAPAEVDISADAFLAGRGFDAEARRLSDIAINANAATTYSMVNVYRSLLLFGQETGLGRTQGIAGGSMRLPEAMARSLKTPVRYNARATAIRVNRSGAEVRFAGARPARASFVVCALPLPVVRRMRIEAPFAPAQREAIQRAAYTQIIQAHVESSRPWWETDGLPPGMWVDGPIERVFAQTDGAGKLTGMQLVWMNGLGAMAQAGKSDEDIAGLVTAELARIRPASAGLTTVRRIVRWTESNPLAGGGYMHYEPGQVGRWASVLPQPAGRLYLAGEHLSRLHTGMEGAMESAENAVLALLEAAAPA
jgi:monoamine oxidase